MDIESFKELEIEKAECTYNESREHYISRMEEEGNKIVYPKENELQIDIDSDLQYAIYQAQMVVMYREFSLDVVETVSRNGLPGRHITITLPFEVSDIERIAFQAALGSDPLRELLSIFRHQRGDDYPTLFVEKGN